MLVEIYNIHLIFSVSFQMPACNDEESAKEAEMTHIDIVANFLTNVSGYGCPIPCHRTNYNIDVKFTNENSWVLYEGLEKRNFFRLFMFYNTLIVEEKVETLMYDLAGLLATAGGNLGLCLGLSCLSIFSFCHSIILSLIDLGYRNSVEKCQIWIREKENNGLRKR